MTLASCKFRDMFSFPALGLPPQIRAAGSFAGTPIAVAALGSNTGNVGGAKKWVFIGMTGSGDPASLWNFWVGGGSASTGRSILPGTSTTTFSGSNSFSATGVGSLSFGSNALVVIEVRQEYIQGLGSFIQWIAPIMSITTGSANGALLSMATLYGAEPASNYDRYGTVFLEVDAY